MSKENVEIVRAVTDGWRRGDAAALALLADDVEYVSEIPTFSGRWHGHEGVIEWFTTWRKEWAEYDVAIEEVLDLGDRVLSVDRHTATGKRSGVPIERRWASLWTLHDGKVVRWQGYESKGEALEAAGLSE
jgi:ketosteroid isomerase-like protein